MTDRQAELYQVVAQLWCLPQHSHKEMDAEFAKSIVTLLAAQRAAMLEEAAQIADHLAQHHDFYDGGYEVGRKIAKECRRQAQEQRP